MKTIRIAIDGPSGAGKSTISKQLAGELSFVYIDTGAMYRAVGLKALRMKIGTRDENALIELVRDISIDIGYGDEGQRVFLDGEDVTSLIRTPEISIAASDVSAIPAVRLKLVELQRELAKSKSVVMDGRDIGSYVLTDAQIKIFLTASTEERAMRRFSELKEKGVECDYDTVYKDMLYRDKNDSTRSFSPLIKAEDAIEINTTGNTLEESIQLVIGIVKERIACISQ